MRTDVAALELLYLYVIFVPVLHIEGLIVLAEQDVRKKHFSRRSFSSTMTM